MFPIWLENHRTKYFRLPVSVIAVLSLDGCIQSVPVSGLYSAEHPVMIGAVKKTTEDYLYIAPDGRITAYVARYEGPYRRTCFKLASGGEKNAALQGRILTPGASPSGEPAYAVKIATDNFGVIERPGPNGVEWFIHNDDRNDTINLKGKETLVDSLDGSYSMTGIALTAPTLAEIQAKMCQTPAALAEHSSDADLAGVGLQPNTVDIVLEGDGAPSLDRLAAAKDLKTLATRLLKPADAASARVAVEWSANAPPLDAGALANATWSMLILAVATAHPDVPPAKERAAMLMMYAFLIAKADGAKCDDTTANGAEQLLFLTAPTRARLSDFPAEVLERLMDKAIALELETAPRRSADPLLCRFGIRDYARAIKQQEDQRAEHPAAHNPVPSPDFAPIEVWRPRQEAARQSFRQYLHILFTPQPKT